MKMSPWFGTMLVLAALAGSARADDPEAIAALKKLGATIIFTDGNPNKPAKTLFLPGKKIKDADLKLLASLTELTILKLDAATNVTDAGLKELAPLKQIQDLGLSSTQVTDAGLKELAGMKDLQKLSLSFCKVTDAGMKDLAMFPKLELLGVSFTQVTPEGVKKLQEALPKCKIIR